MLWKLIDAVADGLALTDDEGMLVLVNRPVNDMFGYGPGELTGRPAETLIPVGLQASHRSHRAAYTRAPNYCGCGIALASVSPCRCSPTPR